MGKKKKPEVSQRLLAEAERDLAIGLAVADICRKLGISEATYYRRRLRFNDAHTDESRRVHLLEAEVARLKELVADLFLDK